MQDNLKSISTPWLSKDNTVIRSYVYADDFDNPTKGYSIQIHCILKHSSMPKEFEFLDYITKHIGFIIIPNLGYEDCYLVLSISLTEDDTIDYFPVKVSVLEDNSTMIWIEEEGRTNKVFKILSSGKDFTFKLSNKEGIFLNLIMENDNSLAEEYEKAIKKA